MTRAAGESVALPAAVRIALGTSGFGDIRLSEAFTALDNFAALGGRIIDTATAYGDGAAESIIGDWLADRDDADQFFVVTKVCHPDEGWRPRVSPRVIRDEVRKAAERSPLRSVLLHRDDETQPIEPLVEALSDTVREGCVPYFGVSNWSAPRLAAFAQLAAMDGHAILASYQYSLARPARTLYPGALAADDEILDVLRRFGIPLIAWAAHAHGWFARKDAAGAAFASPANVQARRRCELLAARLGVPPATLALAWLLAQSRTLVAAVRAESPGELSETMGAMGLVLNDEELSFLGSRGGPRSASVVSDVTQ